MAVLGTQYSATGVAVQPEIPAIRRLLQEDQESCQPKTLNIFNVVNKIFFVFWSFH